MSFMFCECNKLKHLNLLNFTLNGKSEDIFRFQDKNKCDIITKDKNLLNLFYSY